MNDFISNFLAMSLQKAEAEFAGVLLVLAFVVVPVIAALYLLFRRMAARRGVGIDIQWSPGSRHAEIRPGIDSNGFSASGRRKYPPENSAREFDIRRFLGMVYKFLMLTVAVSLLAGTLLAYRAATPGNGLLLVALILGVLALIAFLSIDKIDRQERQAEAFRGLFDELLSKVQVSTTHATPEVHAMDNDAIECARRIVQGGATLDEACRAVNDDYPAWSRPQQEAFQRVMKAVLDRGSEGP